MRVRHRHANDARAWRSGLLTCLLALLALLPVMPQPQRGAVWASTPAPPPWQTDEIIVRLRDETTAGTAVHRAFGARGLRRAGFARAVRLPEGMSVEAALAWYRSRPEVLWAEPNWRVRKANVVPNDPLFEAQWWLRNTGQDVLGTVGAAGADISASAAWTTRTDASAVLVAVVDTGVDYNHPDLANNIWTHPGEIPNNGLDDDGNGYIDDVRGWDFANHDNDPMDDDVDGHGTHVAGIIGAIGDNGLGVSGVAWRVRILPLKFLDASGYGDIAAAAEAIRYAADLGAKVINASYTDHSGCRRVPPSNAEREAIAYARDKGAIVVAAAGNDGCNNDVYPVYPASHPLSNVISVAASDANDGFVLRFPSGGGSNWGPRSVHVSAPGRNILSTTRWSRIGRLSRLQGYDYLSGTSMAAPVVSGVLALLMAQHPMLDAKAAREQLLLSAARRDGLEVYVRTGARVDAADALRYDLSNSAPLTPGHFSAVKRSDTEVRLSWLDDSTIETHWVVERSSGENGAYAEVAVFPSDSAETVTWSDHHVAAVEGTRHAYRVKARNARGDSRPTTESSVVTPPATPTALSAIGAPGRVRLNWLDQSQRETRYHVERAVGSGAFVELAQLPADSTQYEDTAVIENTEYRYRVRAYNAVAGYSAYSDVAIATPTAAASDGGGIQVGCFIATAAYGSALHPRVQALRDLRDQYLLPYAWGRALVTAYYRFSPPLAAFIARHDALRALVRGLLTPLVWLAEQITRPAQAAGWLWHATEQQRGSVIVQFHDAVTAARAEALLRELGARRFERRPAGFYVVETPAGLTVADFIARITAHPEVRYAEPNRRVGKPSEAGASL